MRRTTGYSYMVLDIIKALLRQGVSVDIYAIASDQSREYYGANVLLHSFWDIITNIKTKYLLLGMKRVRQYNPGFRMALTIMYYYASCGLVEKHINSSDYDAIHIHGLGYGGRAYADCCEIYGKRYLLTLHAMASFSARNVRKPGQVRNEEDYLLSFVNSDNLMTVVSSRMKSDICARYNSGVDLARISVVLNGISGSAFKVDDHIDVRSEFHIEPRIKLLLSVGNLSERKNQAAIIRALSVMDDITRKSLCVLFLGEDFLDGELALLAKNKQMLQYVRFCGALKRSELTSFYQQADLNLTVSISEAFGLPIIEGFLFGLPSLMMADLEAKDDLYSSIAMELVKDRTDEALAIGIGDALSRQWDRLAIRKYSEKFSMEETIKGYRDIYNHLTINN